MKKLLPLIFSLCFIVALFAPIKVSAEVDVDGESTDTGVIENEALKSYSVNPWESGYLAYVVDKNGNLASTVKLLLPNENVKTKFTTCKYQAINSIFGEAPSKIVITTFNHVADGSLPTPIATDGNSNASKLKEWLLDDEKRHSLLTDTLVTTEDTNINPDNYYLILESVWYFPLKSSNSKTSKEYICGTTHGYAEYIRNNLLGTSAYPNNGSKKGLTDTGWYGNNAYTNGYFATAIHTEGNIDVSNFGITTSGTSYLDTVSTNFQRYPLNFSVLADKSIGLGLAIYHLSEVNSSPDNPDTDIDVEPTYTDFDGKASVDVKTYNTSSEYDLNENSNPKGRIPSGETLTNGIKVDKWYATYNLTKNTVPSQIAKVYYTYKWDEYYGTDADYAYGGSATVDAGDNSYSSNYGYEVTKTYDVVDKSNLVCTNKTKTHTHTDSCYGTKTVKDVHWKGKHTETAYATKQVERSIYYYTINTYDVLTFRKAEITCENTSGTSAYSGETLIYSYKAGDSVKVSVNIDKSAKNHVTHTPQTKYVTVTGNSWEDCDKKAEAQLDNDADRFIAHNDSLVVTDTYKGVATTHTFISGDSFVSGSEKLPVNVENYDFPDMTSDKYTGLEKQVTIPFTCPNGYYYTSGDYFYQSIVKKTSGMNIHKYASETHTAYLASENERILSGYTQNEPIFVHTPVVTNVDLTGSSETQLVKENTELVDLQLRLDNKYSFQFDIEKHLNLLGYSLNGEEKMYSKYVSSEYGAEVRFPFDVAIVTNSGGEDIFTYYTENTWIRVDYNAETYFYIPSWAKETDYGEIYFRVFAYNFDALSDDVKNTLYNNIDAQDNVNNILSDTNSENQHYIAYTKMAIQLSGYVYGLEVTGCNDKLIFDSENGVNWENNTVAVNQQEQFAKKENEYKSGTKNRLGQTILKLTKPYEYLNLQIHKAVSDWNTKYTLPFANGSAEAITDCLGKGTTIAFTVNTISNLWNSGDTLQITPRFRYVTEDGKGYDYDEIQVYYDFVDNKFTKQGSDNDVMNNTALTGVLMYDSLFVDTYTDDNIKDTATIYSNIHSMNTSRWNKYGTSQVLYTNAGDGVTDLYSLSNIVIPEKLKLFTGNEEWLSYNLTNDGSNIIRINDNINGSLVTSYKTIKDSTTEELVATSNEELLSASMQKWYGQYTVPSSIRIVLTEDLEAYGCSDLYEYMNKKGGIGEDDEIFVDRGYLVLNFDITTYKNGEEDLTYYGNQNMLKVENNRSANHETVQAGETETDITLQDGDIAIFDMLHNLNTYYEVGIGWSN